MDSEIYLKKKKKYRRECLFNNCTCQCFIEEPPYKERNEKCDKCSHSYIWHKNCKDEIKNMYEPSAPPIETELDENNDFTCIICRDKQRDTLFLPCKHLVVCNYCYNNNIDNKSICLLCRSEITSVVSNIFT